MEYFEVTFFLLHLLQPRHGCMMYCYLILVVSAYIIELKLSLCLTLFVFLFQLVTLHEAKLLLKEDDELIREVFEYWSKKRNSCQSGCLIPAVKQEKRDGSSSNDPYVAFRRRTEKMQTRKVSSGF